MTLAAQPLAYTVPEAAELLRVSPEQLYRLIRRGEVKAVHLGRAVRVPRAELERLCGVEPSANGQAAAARMMH